MFGIKTYIANLISYAVDSLWEDDGMPFKFRQVQDIDKNEKKTGENKQTHGQSLETQAKLATNIVHFPRKTNMGKCKRGHSLG